MWNINLSTLHASSIMREDNDSNLVFVGYYGKNSTNPTGDADYGFVNYWSNKLQLWLITTYSNDSTTNPLDCTIQASGLGTMPPHPVRINDFPAWKGTSYGIWYGQWRDGSTYTDSWIAGPVAEFGNLVDNASTTYGFWTVSVGSDPYAATFTHRGTATTDITTNLDAWVRWTRDDTSRYGEYIKVGDAADKKYIGSPRWISDATPAVYYVRDVMRKGERTGSTAATTTYIYGAIHYVKTATKWVIGTVGDEAGWWESDNEPSKTSSVTYSFAKPEGSTIDDKPNIIVTFVDYVSTSTVPLMSKIAEMGIWRAS